MCILFPDNFDIPYYTEVKQFIPLTLASKHCSFELYEELAASLSDDVDIKGVYDVEYEGSYTHSITVIMDNKQYITMFSDLTENEVDIIKKAIRNFTQLKGVFSFTPNKATLVRLTK